MNADGRKQRRLSSESVVSLPPSWSPDGRKIAFTTLGVKWQIYVMNAGRSKQHR